LKYTSSAAPSFSRHKKALKDNAVFMRILFNAIICRSEAPTFHREDMGAVVFSPLKDANQNLSALE